MLDRCYRYRGGHGAMNKLSMGQGNLVRQVELMKELGARTQKSLPIELVDQSSTEPLPSSTSAHDAPLAVVVESTQSQTN
jgi:DNA recombination protein RmuC